MHALRMAKRVQQPNGQTEWAVGFVPPPPWGNGPEPEVAVEDDGTAAFLAMEADVYAAAAQEEGGLASDSESDPES